MSDQNEKAWDLSPTASSSVCTNPNCTQIHNWTPPAQSKKTAKELGAEPAFAEGGMTKRELFVTLGWYRGHSPASAVEWVDALLEELCK